MDEGSCGTVREFQPWHGDVKLVLRSKSGPPNPTWAGNSRFVPWWCNISLGLMIQHDQLALSLSSLIPFHASQNLANDADSITQVAEATPLGTGGGGRPGRTKLRASKAQGKS